MAPRTAGGASERPTWCGACDQRTRLVEVGDDGAPARCPRCHPASLTTTRPDAWTQQVLASGNRRASEDALRIVVARAVAGARFSLNECRVELDAAQVDAAARGAAVSTALARGLLREVGQIRSDDPATHGKRIGVYVAGPALSIGAVT